MISAPLPPRETERLHALRSYGVLDTPPEQDFDDLTSLAARLCEVPIALVSLVDENRQWFKSRTGLDATETPRAVAFCAHAILEEQILVVGDSFKDPRFFDNPLVTGGPKVRFYAGAPLIDKDGHALGTLCVIDQQPKQLSNEKIETLRVLGRQIVSQLELRRSCERLAGSEARYRQIVDSVSDVIFSCDASGRWSYLSPSWLLLVGTQTEAQLGQPAWQAFVEHDRSVLRDLFSKTTKDDATAPPR